MKIGILTFHNAINYGAVLQAYALQKWLNKIDGIEAEIIDYRSPVVDSQYGFVSLKQSGSIKAFLLCNVTTVVRKRKKASFKKFVNDDIKTSPRVMKLNAGTLNLYDAVIVGSDQVWNSSCTKGDKSYLLYVDGLSVRLISYAASIGNIKNFENFQKKYHIDCSNALTRFFALSVREGDAATYIKNITGRECFTVVDPVLLFGRENWIKSLNEFKSHDILPSEYHEEYILVYNIGNFPLTFAFVKALATKTGLKIKTINKDIKGDIKFAGSENCSNVSPSAFVSLIKRAQYIVTDSFHATAFSLMFQKKFFSIANPNSDNTNSRLINILENYKLGNRYITKPTISKDFDTNIDYSYVETKMKIECDESKKWLLAALGLRV